MRNNYIRLFLIIIIKLCLLLPRNLRVGYRQAVAYRKRNKFLHIFQLNQVTFKVKNNQKLVIYKNESRDIIFPRRPIGR